VTFTALAMMSIPFLRLSLASELKIISFAI
jgi:hypothetical protein